MGKRKVIETVENVETVEDPSTNPPIPPYLHTIVTPNPPICTRLNPPIHQ